jgi:predicted metal-dependent peptidase
MSDIDWNDPIVMMLTHAKVKMLFNQPFFGQIATRLKFVDASKWCKTAATDGRHIFYNREFVKNLEPEGLVFLLGHEVLHCILDHLGRRNSKDPKIWNMANDYLVNYILKHNGFDKMPTGGLYDEKYTDEWTSEEVYDDLIANSVEIEFNFDEHLEFDGDDDEDGEDDGRGQGSGDAEGDGGEGSGNEQGGKVKVTVIGRDGPPKLTKKDLRKIKNDMRAAAIGAAQSCKAGQIPQGIKRMIDALIEPKMDWRTLLDAHIRSCVKDDYTFQRPSRRTWGSAAMSGGAGFILPGQSFLDTVDLAIAIDASGSLSDEMLRDFLSEVKGIMETFPDFRVKLWSFDGAVHNYKEFTAQNLEEINSYQPGGGGGTMFEVNWDFMKDNDIEPERFVMFTDGLPNMGWGDPNYCDTLFVVYGNHHIKSPFGLTCHYEPKAQNRKSAFIVPPAAEFMPKLITA